MLVASAPIGGCTKDATSPPPPAPAPVPANAENSGRKWCPGGLLCEDAETLMGYRVPWACGRREVSSRISRCAVRHVNWRPVVEFFKTRYRDVTVTERDVVVRGTSGVHMPVGATPVGQRFGEVPPMLRATRHERAAEIVVITGG